MYTCRANNSAGTAERKLRLAIKCKYTYWSKTHHFLFIVDLLFICHNYICKKKKKKNVTWGPFNHSNITTWKYNVVEIIYSFHSLFKLIVECNKLGNANTNWKVLCQSQIWRKRYENLTPYMLHETSFSNLNVNCILCHNYICKKKKKKNVTWGPFNHSNITTWKYNVVEIIYSFHSLFKLIVECNKLGNANTNWKVLCQSQIWRKRYENLTPYMLHETSFSNLNVNCILCCI